ncbi:MAG: hypothetical protein Q8Q28_04175 [Pseudomonadota bacterium]|nr:hypothetical protein [Pseudomonadota bacterium]
MSHSSLVTLLLALSLAAPALAAERKPVSPASVSESPDPKALLAVLEARLGEGEKLAARLRQGQDRVSTAARTLQDLRSEAFLAHDHAALDLAIAKYDAVGLRAGLDDLAEVVRLPFWKTAELAVPAGLDKGYGKLAGALAKLDAALKPDPRAAADAIPFKRVQALQAAGEAVLPPMFPLLVQTQSLAASLGRAIQGWHRQIDSLRLATGPSTAPRIAPPIVDQDAARIREAVEKEEKARKEKQP